MSLPINSILTLVLSAGIVGYPTVSSAYIIPDSFHQSYGSWSGPGWYIYVVRSDHNYDQLVRGPYAHEDQCRSDLTEEREEDDAISEGLGLPGGSYADECAYFGTQPDFDSLQKAPQ
jgi:hypothetical protein